MSGVPDYPLGDTLDFKFTTRAFATGIPTVLAGTPVIQIYEDNSLVQITAGITLTVSFDAVVGLNHLRVVTTGANGFETGKSYQAVISTGTVGGVSVVGEVIQQFSLERSPGFDALRPTVAARTLDVAATGEAGVDFGNILGTLDAADIGASAITAAKIATNAFTAAKFAAASLNGKGNWNIGKTGYQLSAAGVDDIWDELLAGHVIADSTGLLLNEWQNGGRLDLILDIIAADVVNIDGAAMRGTDGVDTAAMRGTNGANTVTPLSATQVNAEMVDVLTVDTIAELGVGVPAATPTVFTALMLMYMALRNKLDVPTSATDTLELHNDAGTRIAQKLLTDAAGDYSEAKMISGA